VGNDFGATYELFTDAQPLVDSDGLGAHRWHRWSIASGFGWPAKIVSAGGNQCGFELGQQPVPMIAYASFPEQGGSIPIEPILARGTRSRFERARNDVGRRRTRSAARFGNESQKAIS
jgi:hypothetical protein